tara:strand:+ start:249 stop:425 length:177 start_codon:yes stop_codon:yes gene_type:complete
MKTTRGIFAGLDEESFNKIKKTFNVDEAKIEPKKFNKKKTNGKNKKRNSRPNKSHSGK